MLVVGFLLTPFILHRLGDAHYGLFILVGTVIGQGALLDFGIRLAVVKYVAEHHARGDNERLSDLIATALFIYCCLGLLAVVLAAALAPVFPHLFNLPRSEHGTATILVLLMGIGLAISIPCATLWGVLTGLQLYGLVNALAVLGTLASAVATVAVLSSGGGVIAMVGAGVPVTLGVQAIAFCCVRRVAPELHFGRRAIRGELVRAVLSFSTSMSAIEIANNVQTRSDEIVIGALLPVSSVSPYSVARRLSNVPQLLAEQALAAFVPLTSQLHAEGNSDRLRSLYLIGTRVTLAICVPLAGVLTALAGPLLTLWVGAEYAGYDLIVVMLALAGVAEISHWPGQSVLQGLARHHGLAVAYICAAVAKIGLAVLLARSYGLIGVAFATFIAAMALSVGYVFPYTLRILQITLPELLRQALLPALLPALPMMFLLHGMRWTLEPTAIFPVGCTAMAGLAAYAIVYMSFCSGDPERQLLRSLMARITGARSLGQTQP
jgi:O-antigen/teichoic acid export membrane protein